MTLLQSVLDRDRYKQRRHVFVYSIDKYRGSINFQLTHIDDRLHEGDHFIKISDLCFGGNGSTRQEDDD
jgi:hypothetical protein